MTSQKNSQYLTLTCKTPIPKLLFLILSSKKSKRYGSNTARPTHIPYQCAKFCDDRALFNVIFDVCYVKHVKALYPYFGILFLSH